MSIDAVTSDLNEPAPLFCYRHRDRETWVRCGRCDQPICTSCAMQGPVGSRCKTCGTPTWDPLTSMTARQVVLGGLVALAGGAIGGFVALEIGWFSIILGFFIGGFITEAVVRVTGYKRGLRMAGVLVFGIVGGLAIAGVIQYQLSADWIADPEFGMQFFIDMIVTPAIIYAAASLFGAYRRLT